MGAQIGRQLALAIAVVDAAGVACLIGLAAVGDPFGLLNDIANASVGVLSAVLAITVYVGGNARQSRFGTWAGILGGVVMVVGSVAVISELTGWFLAGLVSSLGSAFIGLWILLIGRGTAFPGALRGGRRLLGRTAGAVMLVGVLGLPGIVSRVDDWDIAPWYVNASQLSWLGTYVLYPLWCVSVYRGPRSLRLTAV